MEKLFEATRDINGRYVKGTKMFFKNSKKRSEKISISRLKRKEKLGYINSLKTRKKMSEAQKGEKSFRWKGGPKEWKNVRRRRKQKSKEEIAGRLKPEQCELCGENGVICFDHDHKTGKFRGWICQRCNTTIGFVEDSIPLLLRIIDYLNKNK